MCFSSEFGLQTVRRARDYWRADGIPLLVGSVIYLVVGGAALLLFSIMDWSPPLPQWVSESARLIVAFGMVFGPFLLILIVSWLTANWEDIVEWFKVRLTYPRTGYVAPPSYWENEEEDEENEASARENRVKTLLTRFGGFWFWGFVFWVVNISFSVSDTKMSRPIRAVLLCVLLSIRLARYTLYPEPSNLGTSKLRAFARFLSSVLSSFWLWIFIAGVLLPLPQAFRPWVDSAMVIVLAAFVVWAFTRKEPFFWGVGICVCCTFATFLLSSSETLRFAVAVLVPGFYAFTLGAIRLGRVLRANPVRAL